MDAWIRRSMIVVIVVAPTVFVFGLRLAYEPADFRRLVRELRRHEELKQVWWETCRRIEAREEVAHAVISQRCSVREALEHFQQWDDEKLASLTRLSKQNGWHLSNAEQHYQYLISMVKYRLQNRPKEQAAVLRRLDREYQQLRTEESR